MWIGDFVKKDGHCSMGSYKHQIPMPINGKVRGIDYCIADIVAALNAANITTSMSCCGHGNLKKNIIMLDDGRNIKVILRRKNEE